jgi:DNA-binding PadR family transcriptional regulator
VHRWHNRGSTFDDRGPTRPLPDPIDCSKVRHEHRIRPFYDRLPYIDDRYMVIGMATEVREPTFLVLVALADGPRHGYGVIQDVERLSDGRVKLRAGTLYAMLDRLSSDGLIGSAGEERVDGRLRRYYRLTNRGSAILEAESHQRAALAREALRRLQPKSGAPRLAGGAA